MAQETSHTNAKLSDLTEHEDLIPIMPMIYVAWSDGDLTSDEVRNIRARAAEQDWLSEEAKRRLARWLNPDDPPAPREMTQLLKWMREASGDMSTDERMSLADLGAHIARLEWGEEEEWLHEGEREALDALEDALGIAGEEACRNLLSPGQTRPKQPVAKPTPEFELERMTRVLDGPDRETWQQMRELLQRPEFEYLESPTIEEHRQQVLEWLDILADEGIGALSYPEDVGGEGDFRSFLTAFESLAMFDQSLVIKFGVQFGLFGGSIYFLGTERHHEEYLPSVGNLDLLGGFAMTEEGHGSNVRDIETVAEYDPRSDEFVITTPCDSARKIYIGNAARDGRMMSVFAQLYVDGESYGVHAFLVPVRDEEGNVLPDVRIEDGGQKMGLNGVDNGRIWFDEVRVPRDNMLDEHGRVEDDGTYTSSIPSDTKRFFTMLGTLVGGRVSIAAAATTALKSALTIATRYGESRRQFGPAGEPEQSIMDYRTHKRRLMPAIARAYALNFTLHHLKTRYIERDDEDQREVEALAAGMKAYATWTALDGVQTARECCGGQGYVSDNRICEIRRDIDVFATFEGDNTVLMLLVARGLLSKFQHQFQDERFFSIVRYVAKQAATAVKTLNPSLTRNTDPEHLRSAEFQLNAFQYRADDLLRSAAQRIQDRLQSDMTAFDAFNEVQDHLMSLAKAHIERTVMEQFQAAVESADDPAIANMLEDLRSLFAMERIHEDIGWYLESGYVEPPKSKAIRGQLNTLCDELRPQAVPLVDAFDIPANCLGAPIAQRLDEHAEQAAE